MDSRNNRNRWNIFDIPENNTGSFAWIPLCFVIIGYIFAMDSTPKKADIRRVSGKNHTLYESLK